MEKNLMNCMEIFGSPVSIVLVVYSPLNIKHASSKANTSSGSRNLLGTDS
jgi:hypothetical protein